MKTPKNRFSRLLFDSAWFPAFAWLVGVGIWLGVVIAEAPVRYWCGRWAEEGLGWLALGLVAALTVTGAVAFVRSLAGRRWGRAVVQLLLGAVALVAGVVGYFIADFVSREVAFRTPGVVDWKSAMAPGEPLPFAIEYRRANSFLAEYDKRIAFASGRRTVVGMDTGGFAEFAVYALDAGRFAIADGLGWTGRQRIYRIDPEAESVDCLIDGMWLRLPPDTTAIRGRGFTGMTRHVDVETSGGEMRVTNGVPAGDEFARRRYLGLVSAYGVFLPAGEDSTGDPWAGKLDPAWDLVPGPDGVPFSLEFRPDWHTQARIVWPSGARGPKFDTGGDGGIALYALADGSWCLATDDGDGPRWREFYRIRPEDETIDCGVEGAWYALPSGAVRIGGWGCDSVSLVTPEGDVTVTDSVPFGDSLAGARYAGRFVTEEARFDRVMPDPGWLDAPEGPAEGKGEEEGEN